MADATLNVKITTDYAKATADTQAASGKFSKLGGVMKKAALPAAAIAAGVIAIGKSAADAASKTEQAMGGVDAVFGKSAGVVKKWADDAATSLGLARSEYGELATVIGAQLANTGMPMKDVLKNTGALITKGGDLAAMFGGTTKDAVEALSSALKGETDPIEKYGASITAIDVAAQMAKDGTDKLTGKAGKQAKAMAILKLINEQTATATGAAGRESDSAAAKMQEMSAKVENLKSDLGEALLPVMGNLVDMFGKVAGVIGEHPRLFQGLALGFLAIAGGIMAINVAMIILSANPIVLLVVGIALALAAVAVGFVILYKRSEKFRAVVDAVFGAVKAYAKVATDFVMAVFKIAWAAISAAAKVILPIIKAVFTGIKDAVGIVIDKARDLVDWFRDLKVPTFIKSAFEAIKDTVQNVIGWVQSLGRWFGGLDVPNAIKTAFVNIRDAIDGVIGFVSSLGRWFGGLSVPSGIKTTFENIRDAVGAVSGKIESLIGWIGKIKFPSVPAGIANLLNRSMPDGAAALVPLGPADGFSTVSRAGPGGLFGGFGTSGSGSGITVVNVYGALDPESVARQIGRLVGASERRNGSTRGLRVA